MQRSLSAAITRIGTKVFRLRGDLYTKKGNNTAKRIISFEYLSYSGKEGWGVAEVIPPRSIVIGPSSTFPPSPPQII